MSTRRNNMAARRHSRSSKSSKQLSRAVGKMAKALIPKPKKHVKRRSTSAASRNREYQKQLKAKQKEQTLQQSQKMVDEYTILVEDVQTIHVECEAPIDWSELANREAPFEQGSIGPNEVEAQQAYDNYRPNVLGKLFKAIDDGSKTKLANAIIEAHQKDIEEYDTWQHEKDVAEKVLSGDLDIYSNVIDEIEPLSEIDEYVSYTDIQVISKDIVEVEFGTKIAEVVPNYVLSVLKSGGLSEKQMPKGEYNQLVQDHICSCALRIAREIFALLPVEHVLVHATDNPIDTSTGNPIDVFLLSVDFNRTTIDKINFDEIDPSDSMQNFACNMKFTKLFGLKPVNKIIPEKEE